MAPCGCCVGRAACFPSGEKMPRVVSRTGAWKLEIVKRSDDTAGDEVVPKRWIVERTFAWISRRRRLAREFERYTQTTVAFVRLAMICLRLCCKSFLMNPVPSENSDSRVSMV